MCSPPSSRSDAARQLIERIAAELDVPVGAFFEAKPEAVTAEVINKTLTEQLLAMIALFKQIEHAAVREECLEIVRSRVKR